MRGKKPHVAPPEAPAAAPEADTAVRDEIDRLEREAQALSAEEHLHLQSHVAGDAPPVNAAATYKRLIITLQNLRANSKALLSLRADRAARWSEGLGNGGLVGLSLVSTRDPALYVRNFSINPRELYLQTYQDSQEIQIQLYVQSTSGFIQGRVDLPPGANVTFQSERDRTSVIGLSAFALDLD
jgi:hypothetical protein